MTLSGLEQTGRGPLGLIYVFFPGSVRREAALGPSRASLRTLVSRFRVRWLAGLPSMEILWAWLEVRIKQEG